MRSWSSLELDLDRISRMLDGGERVGVVTVLDVGQNLIKMFRDNGIYVETLFGMETVVRAFAHLGQLSVLELHAEEWLGVLAAAGPDGEQLVVRMLGAARFSDETLLRLTQSENGMVRAAAWMGMAGAECPVTDGDEVGDAGPERTVAKGRTP